MPRIGFDRPVKVARTAERCLRTSRWSGLTAFIVLLSSPPKGGGCSSRGIQHSLPKGRLHKRSHVHGWRCKRRGRCPSAASCCRRTVHLTSSASLPTPSTDFRRRVFLSGRRSL